MIHLTSSLNVSAKPISAHCTVSTTAPQASTLHEFMENGERETLTVLVSISPWQLKAGNGCVNAERFAAGFDSCLLVGMRTRIAFNPFMALSTTSFSPFFIFWKPKEA